jgi:sulfur carrier protein
MNPTDSFRDAATNTASAPITVVVNGNPESTTARNLQAWVDAREVPPAALATAVNGNFVPRSLRAQQPLAEGDTILTFQPIEGG